MGLDIKWKWEAGNDHRKREVSGQNRRVGISDYKKIQKPKFWVYCYNPSSEIYLAVVKGHHLNKWSTWEDLKRSTSIDPSKFFINPLPLQVISWNTVGVWIWCSGDASDDHMSRVVHSFSISWQKFPSNRIVIIERRRRSLLGVGACPTKKFLHFKFPETEFPWFWAQISNTVSAKSNHNFSILFV